jgi:hypothetical protein
MRFFQIQGTIFEIGEIMELHIYRNCSEAYLATSLDEAWDFYERFFGRTRDTDEEINPIVELEDNSLLTIVYDDTGDPLSEETHTCKEWMEKSKGKIFIGQIEILSYHDEIDNPIREKWLQQVKNM